jgi:hypothetical protein
LPQLQKRDADLLRTVQASRSKRKEQAEHRAAEQRYAAHEREKHEY